MAKSASTEPKLKDEEMGVKDEDDEESPEGVPLLSKAKNLRREAKARHVTVTEQIAEKGGKDVLQFSAPMYFADETDGMLNVDIIRLGSMEGKVAVKYFTKDVSAKSSTNYESVSGHLVFGDGEYSKTIEIPIMDDGDWTPTAEFKVCLASPQNCKLGLYLHASRVKIINSEAFPSEVFREDVDQGYDAIDNIPVWSLFGEYCKLNRAMSGLKSWTVLVLVMDQLANILLFISLWVGVYLVDTVFARGGHSKHLLVPDRYQTAIVISLWYVVPHIVLYAWDDFKTRMDIEGASREFLQLSLMRTYFDFTHEARERISPADMDTAIGRGASEISEAFVAGLSILGLIGRVIVVFLFMVMFQPDPLALSCVIIMVLVLIAFSIFRVRISQRARARVEEKDAFVSLLTEEATRKYQLTRDYSKRSAVSDMFAHAVHGYTQEKIPENLVRLNTAYFTKFLSGSFICIYIIVKTPAVLNNEVSLGVFLATITIFGTYLAEAIAQLNDQLAQIIDAFVPLQQYTKFLNLPLDLSILKRINLERREHTNKRRSHFMRKNSTHNLEEQHTESEGAQFTTNTKSYFKSDLLPIEMLNLTFEYTPGVPVFKDVSLALEQGCMISVTGPHRAGKATFMELMSNIRAAKDGSLMVPSHLRILHVSREPMFLQATILSNLCLGLPYHEAINLNRILEIVKVCGVGELVADIKAEASMKNGMNTKAGTPRNPDGDLVNDEIQFSLSSAKFFQSLSSSQKVKLHLARALISNPEIMVVQRSLEGLSSDSASFLIEVLRQHMTQRGLCLPEEDRSTRRPRTVFFSTESGHQALKADVVLQLDPKTMTVEKTVTADKAGKFLSSG